jgi:hypothetical protein
MNLIDPYQTRSLKKHEMLLKVFDESCELQKSCLVSVSFKKKREKERERTVQTVTSLISCPLEPCIPFKEKVNKLLPSKCDEDYLLLCRTKAP